MANKTGLVDQQVGSRARTLRNAAGVSIARAAAEIGVSVEEYGQLENGEVRFTPRQLITLAAKFGVGASEFLQDIEFAFSVINLQETAPNHSSIH